MPEFESWSTPCCFAFLAISRRCFHAQLSAMPSNDVEEAIDLIRNSQSILAVLGAGLSAPSGIPTFRHEGAHWRGGPMDEMSKPAALDRDPVGVWTFYENRRQMARVAQPNAGHYALASLAQAKPSFLAVTQNIDGMISCPLRR